VNKVYLSNSDRKIVGVCGGLGENYEKDSTLTRILFVLLILFAFGSRIIIYLLMWLIVPKKPGGLMGEIKK
jgi:phage shock protein C